MGKAFLDQFLSIGFECFCYTLYVFYNNRMFVPLGRPRSTNYLLRIVSFI